MIMSGMLLEDSYSGVREIDMAEAQKDGEERNGFRGCAEDGGDGVVGEDGGDVNCLPIIPCLGPI